MEMEELRAKFNPRFDGLRMPEQLDGLGKTEQVSAAEEVFRKVDIMWQHRGTGGCLRHR